ncbi:MAG: TlyA family rRNA (cytidine-2'-O)-methyltransferase [Dehalococcoidia bacterium]|nr:TlyA family rRNA (cytidine-2'-O)-methyltransferase [Dehalococcoidia bacterium]
MARQRLDQLLVERGLADSRAKARALVMAGDVLVDGQLAQRAGLMVGDAGEVNLKQKQRYVSRGGFKLEHALDRFGLDVTGFGAADLGASTGGFTDCLLQHGATKVYAIDVGHGQLDQRLREDPRVVTMEKVNARDDVALPEKVDLVTADLSFISLTKVLPAAVTLLKPQRTLIALLKPQFEAEPKEVRRGGVVRDTQTHAKVIGRFLKWATAAGLSLLNLALSPITGPAGNREFLIQLAPS